METEEIARRNEFPALRAEASCLISRQQRSIAYESCRPAWSLSIPNCIPTFPVKIV